MISKNLSKVLNVHIDAKVYESLCNYSINSSLEICGGLYGYVDNTTLIILQNIPSKNFSHSNTSFILDIDELLTKNVIFNNKKLYLVGIYHSHPNASATLSDMDCYFLSIASWLWFIIAFNKNSNYLDVACFKKLNNCIQQIDYSIISF